MFRASGPGRELTGAERSQAAAEREKIFISKTTSECRDIAIHVHRLASDSRGYVNEKDLQPLLVRLYEAICTLADYRRGPYERLVLREQETQFMVKSNDEYDSEGIVSDSDDEDDNEDSDSEDNDTEDDESEADRRDFESWAKNNTGGLEADQALLGVWYAVLESVNNLSKLEPEGPFLAARMILFTQLAISKTKSLPRYLENGLARFQLQADLGRDLDEALLIQLRRAWDHSKHTDNLCWATTYLHVHKRNGIFNMHNLIVMSACSPSKFRTAQKEAEKYVNKGRLGPSRMFASPNLVPTFRDGPIAITLINTVFEKSGYDGYRGMGVRGPSLQRSYYFVQDIRQQLASAIPKERLRMASRILHRLFPSELVTSILDYVDTTPGRRDIHPYLARLDIGAAYAPFPKHEVGNNTACSECTKACSNGTNSPYYTCPRGNIYVWNLALRAFHTFHRGWDGCLSMCKHKGICQSHHTDQEWRVKTKEDVREYAQDIYESRCQVSSLPAGAKRWFTAMTTINPHTNPDSFMVPDATHLGPEILFPTLGLMNIDAIHRYCKEGGRCGIVSSMLHSYVHPPGPPPPRPLNHTRGQWAYGRSKLEEAEVATVLLDLEAVEEESEKSREFDGEEPSEEPEESGQI